jgi:hypothetical protein
VLAQWKKHRLREYETPHSGLGKHAFFFEALFFILSFSYVHQIYTQFFRFPDQLSFLIIMPSISTDLVSTSAKTTESALLNLLFLHSTIRTILHTKTFSTKFGDGV